MMEKLLHERLRELENWCQLYERYNIREVSFTKLMEFFADEIERCYIPRPRFEDGEPAQFKVGGLREVRYRWCYEPFKRHVIETTLVYDDGSEVVLIDGEFVKRPTPKVYDADGVEIKVGDEVWDLKGLYDVPLTVLEPNDGCSVKVTIPDGKGYTGFIADQLTHERPVFDAEGERIRKGDTVWTTVRMERFTVESMDGAGGTIECVDDGGKSWEILPSDLTKREPDSIESIAQYAKDEAVKYAGCIEPLNKIADRLAALIEMGA